MEWIGTVQGIITLIISLVSLISGGVTAFIGIRSLIKSMKEKSFKENWETIKALADAAMKEYEHSALKGAAKKTAVINSVKAGAHAAGINIDLFLDQLSAFIDQSISWYNNMQNKD